jgi:peptide/nickel transport system substrate-binding protein
MVSNASKKVRLSLIDQEDPLPRRSRTTRRLRAVAAVAVLASLASLATAAAGSAGSASKQATKDTLIVLREQIAPQMNPDGTTAGDPGMVDVFKNVYWRLVDYPTTKRGDIIVPNYKVKPMNFVPRLAESYSKKGLTWTFKLRKGIKSCAGNELSADDVVYTFARAKSVSGGSPVAWFLANVGSVLTLDPLTKGAKDPKAKELAGEVVKVDEHTVRIKQFGPNELFPRVLEIFALNIFDSVEMKKQATAKDPWAHDFANNKGTAGYGPYCVTRWNKGSEVNLGFNPNWTGAKPQFTNVVIRKVPQNANRVAALRAGKADVATTLTPTEYDSLRTAKGVKVLGWYNNQSAYVYANYKIEPWGMPGNEKLRRAMAYAMPYEDIVKLDYKGSARIWNGVVVSTYNDYAKVLNFKTDLAMAKKLMAEAGYPEGKGLEKYPTAFSLTYPAERSATLEPVVNRIRTNLRSIGMPITLNPIPQAEFADRFLAKRDLPMALVDYGAAFGPDAVYAVQLFFVSPDKGGINNGMNYSSKAMDDATFAALSASGAARTAKIKLAQQIIARDQPAVSLYEFQSQLAVRDTISGWLVSSDNSIGFYTMTSKD